MKTLHFVSIFVLLLALHAGCGSAASAPESEVPTLASIAEAETARLMEAGARRVDLLVLDLRGGEAIAQAHHGPRGPVPLASPIKPLTLAAALRAGFDANAVLSGEGERT
ncbi:MAG: hypothetical protein AAF411_18030, partial [Myxococcota bacterium]